MEKQYSYSPKRLMATLPVTLFLLLAVDHAIAVTYSVKQGGTGDFTTIQACGDVVQAGDICMVYPGIYDERISNTEASYRFVQND